MENILLQGNNLKCYGLGTYGKSAFIGTTVLSAGHVPPPATVFDCENVSCHQSICCVHTYLHIYLQMWMFVSVWRWENRSIQLVNVSNMGANLQHTVFKSSPLDAISQASMSLLSVLWGHLSVTTAIGLFTGDDDDSLGQQTNTVIGFEFGLAACWNKYNLMS